MLCPAYDMNTTKIERLISQVEHDSFEHRMTELASAPNSTIASNKRILWCVDSNPDKGKHLISHTHSLHMSSIVALREFEQ